MKISEKIILRFLLPIVILLSAGCCHKAGYYYRSPELVVQAVDGNVTRVVITGNPDATVTAELPPPWQALATAWPQSEDAVLRDLQNFYLKQIVFSKENNTKRYTYSLAPELCVETLDGKVTAISAKLEDLRQQCLACPLYIQVEGKNLKVDDRLTPEQFRQFLRQSNYEILSNAGTWFDQLCLPGKLCPITVIGTVGFDHKGQFWAEFAEGKLYSFQFRLPQNGAADIRIGCDPQTMYQLPLTETTIKALWGAVPNRTQQ